MTEEAYTYEAFDFVDYSDQLSDLIQQGEDISYQLETLIDQVNSQAETLEQLEYLQYLPYLYQSCTLILGVIIVYILFRFVVSFLNRIFSDKGNY